MKALKLVDEHFEEFFLCVFLVVITLVLGAQIVARILNHALSWSEELARFLFVWSGFLSISYCIRKKISLKIEQVVDFFPAKGKAVFHVIEELIMLVFYAYMIQFAYTYFANAIASAQLSPAMQIPMYLVQIAPLLGFALTIIRLLQSLYQKIMILFKKGEPA